MPPALVQLDAYIMFGPGHKGGGVALQAWRAVASISAARRVMEKTRHVMLVGEGRAQENVRPGGLESIPLDIVNSPTKEWKRNVNGWQDGQNSEKKASNHGTHPCLLVLGANGTVAGRGVPHERTKPASCQDGLVIPPILGSGLYVDNEVGAAGGGRPASARM